MKNIVTTVIYTLSLHDALPISIGNIADWIEEELGTGAPPDVRTHLAQLRERAAQLRSEEHTSELQSLRHLVCRLLLEKKKNNKRNIKNNNITSPQRSFNTSMRI